MDAEQPVPVHGVLPGSHHQWNPQPVPVTAHGHALLRPRGRRHCHCGLRAGRLEARYDHHGVPGRDHLPRPLERLHGHPGRNAGSHRGGHDPGRHLRRRNGPVRTGGPDPSTHAGRRPDHAGFCLPGSVPWPLWRHPLHGDHCRHHLRRARGHQDHRGWHYSDFTDSRRSCRLQRFHPLAGHHQGPAADGQAITGPRRKPGPDLRPGHGGGRCIGGRRRPRVRRRRRLCPKLPLRQGPRRGPCHCLPWHPAGQDDPGGRSGTAAENPLRQDPLNQDPPQPNHPPKRRAAPRGSATCPVPRALEGPDALPPPNKETEG